MEPLHIGFEANNLFREAIFDVSRTSCTEIPSVKHTVTDVSAWQIEAVKTRV